MTKEELLETAKPILFNTDMVKAILEGRKTVTRRVVKPQPNEMIKRCENCDPINCCDSFDVDRLNETVFKRDGARCYKHYRIGDILYVRETWCEAPYEYEHIPIKYGYITIPKIAYRADSLTDYTGTWKPSIHMPKSAARIFLKITNVQVERLQDITPRQAESEGTGDLFLEDIAYGEDFYNLPFNQKEGLSKEQFAYLWDSTIKKQDLAKYGWNANPWVWVYEFERIDANV